MTTMNSKRMNGTQVMLERPTMQWAQVFEKKASGKNYNLSSIFFEFSNYADCYSFGLHSNSSTIDFS